MGIQINGTNDTISDSDNGFSLGGTDNKLRLYGATSGYVEIDAPATAGSNTLTLPDGNGTSGQYLQTDGSGGLSWVTNPALFQSYAILAHVESDGTNGGSSVADTWTTRTINTEVADPDGIVTLSSNQFTLGAGSYLIEWACVAYDTNFVTSRLYDSTNTAAIQNSLVLFTSLNYDGAVNVSGSARVSPTGSTAYEIQMNTNASNAGDGFGADNPATGAGDEVYLFVKIYKEA